MFRGEGQAYGSGYGRLPSAPAGSRPVEPRSVAHADQKPLWSQQPGDGLSPWLGAGVVYEAVAPGLEFLGRRLDVGHLELDRGLWDRHVLGPFARAEARLGGISEWPLAVLALCIC